MQHIELTLIAVGIGFAIAFPLALLAHRYGKLEQPFGVLSALLYTIPSLALFQLLVPFTGLTWTTVEIALVAYTLVILFPNIVAGLHSAPADVLEAARGMGLTRRQVLLAVELPLAVPAIIGGLRIAVVSTVAIATIAAILLPEGLGYPIFLALKEPTPFKTEIYAAGVLAVALALSCDLLLVALRRVLVPWAAKGSHDARRRRATCTRSSTAFRFIGDHPGFLLHEGARAARAVRRRARDRRRRRPPARRRARPLPPRLRLAIGASIVGRALPSLVLIAAFLTMLGIGFVNNMVALAVLGSGPILTNSYDAIDRVDRDTVEAARGMGMTGRADPPAGRAAARDSPALHGNPHRSGHDRRDRADRRDRRRRRPRRHHRQPGELPSRRASSPRRCA